MAGESDDEGSPTVGELLALRRTIGEMPYLAVVDRTPLTNLGELARRSQVAEVTISGAVEVQESVERTEGLDGEIRAVEVALPFTVNRWLNPSSGPASSELVMTVSASEGQPGRGQAVAEELAARVPVGAQAVFFMEPRPAGGYWAAYGGMLFLTGDGTAVSMEPTLADDDPVGLVPMADLVERVEGPD